MGIDDILKRIRDDADKAAGEKKAVAEKTMAGITKEAEEKARFVKEEILKQAAAQAEVERQRLLSGARLALNKDILAVKRGVISEAFSQAKEAFLKLALGAIQELFRKALLAETETGEETVVISAAEKERITVEFIEEINKELPRQDKKGSLTLQAAKSASEDEAGFLLKGKRRMSDCRFSSLIAMVQDDIEPEIAKILF